MAWTVTVTPLSVTQYTITTQQLLYLYKFICIAWFGLVPSRYQKGKYLTYTCTLVLITMNCDRCLVEYSHGPEGLINHTPPYSLRLNSGQEQYTIHGNKMSIQYIRHIETIFTISDYLV